MTVAALEAITITARIIAMMNVVRDVVLVFPLAFSLASLEESPLGLLRLLGLLGLLGFAFLC